MSTMSFFCLDYQWSNYPSPLGFPNSQLRNYYPLEEAKRSNLRHRPIGLGAQKNGAANVWIDDALDGDDLMAMDFRESIH